MRHILAVRGVTQRRRLTQSVLGVFLLLAGAQLAEAQTLAANPGPANNGGGAGWAIFFDLTALSGDVVVTEMTTASTAAADATFTVEVFTRVGTALGGSEGSGPGSSPAGWTSLGTATATQGATSNEVSLAIDIPDIVVPQGQLTGVAILFTDAGPRYFGTGSPPLETYSDASLELETGDARSQPFTTDPAFFSSRALVGSLTYQVTSPSDEAPVSILEIPTASFWGLLLLALALGAGALVTLLRRVG